MGIENWSTTPANNNSPSPNGAPEGWAPSHVNDVIRQQMADHRSKWEDAQWFNWGYTHTYASSTSFTISGNYTSTYAVGSRVRAVGSSTGTIYGRITGSTYSAPNTTVTVSWISGSLSNETLTVSLGTYPDLSSTDSGKGADLVEFSGKSIPLDHSQQWDVDAGEVGAGDQRIFDLSTSLSGDSGGTTDGAAIRLIAEATGANPITAAHGLRVSSSANSTAHITSLFAGNFQTRHENSGDINSAYGLTVSHVSTSSAGDMVQNLQMIRLAAPSISGSTNIPEAYGLRMSDIGHANIDLLKCIYIIDQTATDSSRGIELRLSDTGNPDRYNIYAGGDAPNYFAGHVGIGASNSATAVLAVGAATTAKSSLRIPHGTAPSSPVNGDIWTTTAGLFVRINGSTVGPLS